MLPSEYVSWIVLGLDFQVPVSFVFDNVGQDFFGAVLLHFVTVRAVVEESIRNISCELKKTCFRFVNKNINSSPIALEF